MSTTLVKVQHKGQVTVPSRLRQQAGIAEGDIVEATFQRAHIIPYAEGRDRPLWILERR